MLYCAKGKSKRFIHAIYVRADSQLQLPGPPVDFQITTKSLIGLIKRFLKILSNFFQRKFPLFYRIKKPIAQHVAQLSSENPGKGGAAFI